MVTRPIRFVRFDKPRGRTPTVIRDLLVVDFITRQRRKLGKEDAALFAAEQHFKLRKSRIHAIWAEHKERVGEGHSSSKRKRKSAPQRTRRSTK